MFFSEKKTSRLEDCVETFVIQLFEIKSFSMQQFHSVLLEYVRALWQSLMYNVNVELDSLKHW